VSGKRWRGRRRGVDVILKSFIRRGGNQGGGRGGGYARGIEGLKKSIGWISPDNEQWSVDHWQNGCVWGGGA